MKLKNTYIIIGLMLFALFFGAGNLIYPAYLGIYSGSNWAWAIIGFCLTGVTLPLLGVAAVAYSGATDVESFTKPVSKTYAIFFAVALYLSIGPFFAIPRTGATSFSVGIQPILGDSSLVKIIYGLIFFGISYFLAIRPSQIVDRIGKYLTPFLLTVISILIIASLIHPAAIVGTPHNASTNVSDAFKDLPFLAGLIQGYGTMDALASIAFVIIVIQASKQYGAITKKEITSMALKSGAIATFLLAFIYIFVGRIGATSQSLFKFANGSFLLHNTPIDGGHVLSQSANFYLGIVGQAILGTAIFLACLTTATGLITACAEYFHKLLPKISHITWATIFTLIAITFYFGGLSEIIRWSLPVLYLLYPLTIVLIFLVFFDQKFESSRIVYQTSIAATAVAALYDALSKLGEMTGLFTIPSALTTFFTKVVPLGEYSMGWISFAICGVLVGLILKKVKA